MLYRRTNRGLGVFQLLGDRAPIAFTTLRLAMIQNLRPRLGARFCAPM